MNIFGLESNIISKINEIFSEYPEIVAAMIYGSRAKGNYTNGSDIDISIIAPEMDFKRFMELFSKLEELNIPYKIDLTKFELIDDKMKEHIKRVGKVFYQNPNSRR